MKKCSKCNELKSLDGFYKNKRNLTNGLSAYCKECQKSDKKIHYKNNKEKYARNVFNNSKWLIDLKIGLKCEKCGFNHPAALDFHHLDPSTKEFTVSGRMTCSKENKEKVLNEIKKCIILCSNCHRIEHATNYNEYLMEGAGKVSNWT